MTAETWLAIAGWVGVILATAVAAFSARAAGNARRFADAADRRAAAAETQAEATRRQVGTVERDHQVVLERMAQNVRRHQLRRLEDEHASCQALLDTVKSMLGAADHFIDLQDQGARGQRYDLFMTEIILLTPNICAAQLHMYSDTLLQAAETTVTGSYKMLDAVQRMQREDEATSASADYLDGFELLRKVCSDLEQYATAAAARATPPKSEGHQGSADRRLRRE